MKDMLFEAVKQAAFSEKLREWMKQAFLAPGQLVTRKQLADKLPTRRIKDSDIDDEPGTGTANRTARNPAFDG